MTRDPKPLTGQGNTRKALDVLTVPLVVLCIVLLAVAGARWAAGRPSSTVSTVGVGQSEHAKVEAVGKTGLHRVVLTPEAAERLGIETAQVSEETGAGRETVVPYPAVYYDVHGATWVYTNPEPLVFVRQRVTVDRIDDDDAILSEGPQPGTRVVIVGVDELLGTEFGGLVEQ
ncbi:MAG: hypothetical protein E6H04_08115 [Bacillati bacterium ANGP1]|uniref:Uncharacterized protein n=1 Tax=Candidatus Segetimicrobium genomatis TaxID=2569760 RepID=A0A537JAX8_9BACT|nr:MAG: hypothetical protein E6H04_08115 [Terrabacteria group bacterium ANGP1]